jgi:hypothetical protein
MNRNIGWIFGGNQHTGQVLLSTIETFNPTQFRYETVASLPMITEEFMEVWSSRTTPSYGWQALEKQDLFINSLLTQMGCSLLWSLFRYGMTPVRNFPQSKTFVPTHKSRLMVKSGGKRRSLPMVGTVFFAPNRIQLSLYQNAPFALP